MAESPFRAISRALKSSLHQKTVLKATVFKATEQGDSEPRQCVGAARRSPLTRPLPLLLTLLNYPILALLIHGCAPT